MSSVTIGSDTFTVYADAAAATTYANGAYGPIWTKWRASDSDSQARALVTSTRIIDALSWPSGYIDDTEWQAQIIPASIELAASILDGSLAENISQASDPVRRLRAGSVEIDYFRVIKKPSLLPDMFRSLMGKWLGGSGDSVSGTASYGTDRCSSFDQTYRPNQGVG